MYIPKHTTSGSQLQRHTRLGIQGPPKSGKTTSAVTFPNPIILNFDNGLPLSFDGPSVDFWNADFIKKCESDLGLRSNAPDKAPNRRDVFKYWLAKNVSLFVPGQSVILDSWTFMQNWFDIQTATIDRPVLSKQGEEDRFAFWKQKKLYCIEIANLLDGLNCNLVTTYHETYERDKDGNLLEKIAPLQDGEFKQQIKGHYTDWFRQHAQQKKDAQGRPMDRPEYVWQIKSDGKCDCACKNLSLNEKFVPARYDAVFAQAPVVKIS